MQAWEAGKCSVPQQRFRDWHFQTGETTPEQGSMWEFRADTLDDSTEAALIGGMQQPMCLDTAWLETVRCSAPVPPLLVLSSRDPADLGPAAHAAIQNRMVQQLRWNFTGQEQHQSVFQSSCQDLAGADHQLPPWQLPELNVSVHHQLEAHMQELMQTLRNQSQEAEAALPDRFVREGTCNMFGTTACSQACCPQPAVSGRPGADVETLLHPTTLSYLDDHQQSKGISAAPHGVPAAADPFPGGSKACRLFPSCAAGQATASGNCPAGHNHLQTPFTVQQEVGACSHSPGPLPEDDSMGPDLIGHQQPSGVFRQLLAILRMDQLQRTGSMRKVWTKPASGSSLYDSPSTSLSSILSP